MNAKRRRKKRQARRLSLERLEDRCMLAGLQVVDVTPDEVRNAVFDHVEVTFNQEINAATFTKDDVSITGPTSDVAVSGIESIDGDTFRIDFAELAGRGNYEIVIGPETLDLDGDAMDQDGDGTSGEQNDVFTSPHVARSKLIHLPREAAGVLEKGGVAVA